MKEQKILPFQRLLNPSKCRIELNNISAGEQLKIACRKDNILTEGHNVIDISMETLIFLQNILMSSFKFCKTFPFVDTTCL